uniref:Si:ch211-266o15.1 n=1 Tax=Amphilophus citrinellus TaxID=61819 RepID=A0A3Q0TCB0_AMPCI
MSPVQVGICKKWILILIFICVTLTTKCIYDLLGFHVSTLDQSTSESGDMKSEVVAPTVPHHEEAQKEEEEPADLPLTQSSEKSPETADPEPEMSKMTSDPAASCAEDQPPTSPMMDLESDFPPAADLVEVKEDVLQCNSAELSFGLSRFIKEVRRPNGETYSPDSIFYLCLGIQQHLFMMGRIENIFTDQLYSQFTHKDPSIFLAPGGAVSSRVEESYLWECKQLGAYSPIVLLNTLLFFCTKHFHFNTVEKHQRLSFSNFTRHSKPCSRAGKVEAEGDLEMMENVTNPLHCPVRLYEFYLSRCPESVKKRTNVFYLQPEQNVHTHSPHWYTSQPLDATTLQSMLTRILAVREVQKEQKAASIANSTTSLQQP